MRDWRRAHSETFQQRLMPPFTPNLETPGTQEIYSNGHCRPKDWLVLDDRCHWAPSPPSNSSGGFIYSNSPLCKSVEKLGLLRPLGVKRWTAIGTFNDPYWNRVKHGIAWRTLPANTQFLLWERDSGGFGILLPLLSGDHVSTLQGEKGGVRLVAAGGEKNRVEKEQAVAYAATGQNIYDLVDKSMQAVAAYTKSFRLRCQKKAPEFVDYLGWCSWDAFYSKIDEAKFLSALNSFQRGGIKPGFVILDDGWLDHRGDFLRGFGINGEKFPNGLSSLVTRAKQEYGIKFFGIWHAMTGYWGGVDPQSPLGRKYHVLEADGMIRPWIAGKKDRLYLINPGQASRFYTEFHQALKASGVDLIKVDGQSALTEFTRPHYGRVSSMRTYQHALQSSAIRHFDGGMIHCMSNGLDVAYQLEQTLVWRNSDDFFPKKSSVWQQIHVHANALNNLWTSTFALPDWDMFQSHHRWADFHAAARALSGGPIYVCDKPGRQNFSILRRLASDDGRVWRCDRPALPAPESIFADCRTEPVLLKIHNRSGDIGLIGLFHCSEVKRRLSESYSPANIPDLTGSRFIARRHSSGQIEEMNRDEWSKVTLPRMGYEIITISPILGGWVAPLGRPERYTGATSIESTALSSNGTCDVSVRESGNYLFWCRHPPAVMTGLNGPPVFKYNRKTKLLNVAMKAAGRISISSSDS
jgi:raffinose synthase